MNFIVALIAGIACGAGSYALGGVLSGTFEPFDSGIGFLSTQVVLGCAAFWVAYKYSAKPMLAMVLGGYFGLILYPYIFGSSETRGWILLGAITTLALVVMPLLAGLVGVLMRRLLQARAEKGPAE